MLIGELSRRTDVPAHQLRYYEAQGLLESARAANGYRDYGEESVVTVTQIRRLLEAGLSTEEIAFLQPCVQGVAPDLEPCAELLTALRQRRNKLDRQIDALTQSREALDAYIRVTEQKTDPLAPSTCATR
ncbi:MerR family transcriptional regulator [Streptomyces sp. NPDC006356]